MAKENVSRVRAKILAIFAATAKHPPVRIVSQENHRPGSPFWDCRPILHFAFLMLSL
jgi:hypothetical protein